MLDKFTSTKIVTEKPRLPLKGSLDLTYRCNNCWLRTDDGKSELTSKEIIAIVDDAWTIGCQEWAISGGEPMLRPDFAEIFDYITTHSKTYSLNTNGTQITEEIVQLIKLKGNKMVAFYGATVDVNV